MDVKYCVVEFNVALNLDMMLDLFPSYFQYFKSQAVGETKARCTGGLGVTSVDLQTGLYAAGEERG